MAQNSTRDARSEVAGEVLAIIWPGLSCRVGEADGRIYVSPDATKEDLVCLQVVEDEGRSA